jgi:hypothetical protein
MWELQQAQVAYQPKLAEPKIAYNRFLATPGFCFDDSGAFLNDAPYFIPSPDEALSGLLNSRLAWFQISSRATLLRGGYYQLHAQYVEGMPIPGALTDLQGPAETCRELAAERLAIEHDVRDRILDLASIPRRKLPRTLEGWHRLDWKALQAVLKSALRIEIAPRQQGEWKAFFAENASLHRALSARIADAEREIDTTVYALFELTPEEIALLESASR